MDADDGVCAYSLADPVDALTVAWRDDDMVSSDVNTKCTGHCNFGVSLITDYLDEDGGKIKQKKIRAHRGIMLLSLVERHDPQMEWDASHPDIAAKSGRTVIYEWGITPVDIVGTIEESNLCLNDGQGVTGLKTEFGDTKRRGRQRQGHQAQSFPALHQEHHLVPVSGDGVPRGGRWYRRHPRRHVRPDPHGAPRDAEAET